MTSLIFGSFCCPFRERLYTKSRRLSRTSDKILSIINYLFAGGTHLIQLGKIFPVRLRKKGRERLVLRPHRRPSAPSETRPRDISSVFPVFRPEGEIPAPRLLRRGNNASTTTAEKRPADGFPPQSADPARQESSPSRPEDAILLPCRPGPSQTSTAFSMTTGAQGTSEK